MQGDWLWHELITPDPKKAEDFYGKLLGWKTSPMPAAGGPTYTLWQRDGKNHGGMMKPPMPGIPPHWEVYIKVDDVGALADRVPKLGGKVRHGPTDIPDVGRIAIIEDPTGAVIALITPKM